MAVIISPYVGDARGKLGEGVFMRSKGQTIVRGYNPSPLNRRTQRQQTQRAQFSAAVKFFSRGVQNLFVFAYEDKRTRESDYNAFMRYNAKLGMYMGPAELNNDAWPCLAPWTMTRGSLVGATPVYAQTPRIYIPGIETVPQRTVGALSQAIIDASANYEVGDILTFVNIDSGLTAGSPSYPYSEVPFEVPEWQIYQLILDPSDSTPLPVTDWYMQASVDDGLALWPHQTDVPTAFACGVCYVHSRVRNGKVYVSDSNLVLNAMASQVYSYGRSETWKAVVMSAWGTEQESILQGSIAARQRPATTEIVLTFQPPIDSADLTAGATITITGGHTLSDIEDHLQVLNDDGDDYQLMADGDRISMIPPGQTISSSLAWSYTSQGDAAVLTFTGGPSGYVIQSLSWV